MPFRLIQAKTTYFIPIFVKQQLVPLVLFCRLKSIKKNFSRSLLIPKFSQEGSTMGIHRSTRSSLTPWMPTNYTARWNHLSLLGSLECGQNFRAEKKFLRDLFSTFISQLIRKCDLGCIFPPYFPRHRGAFHWIILQLITTPPSLVSQPPPLSLHW